MDKSETFIKMCDCEEIQSQQENVEGVSFFWVRGDIYNHDTGEFLYKDEREIFLPSQDQLQAMIGKFDLFHFWRKVFSMDDEGVDYEQPKWTYHCDSWEQLWLALAMKELHNKTWDSVKEEWINE